MTAADRLLAALSAAQASLTRPLLRFQEEVKFAVGLIEAHPDRAVAWQPLLDQAVSRVVEGISAGAGDTEALVAEAEALLAPLCAAAKEYTLFCVGHAHIDMNWMWTWPETVAVSYDTFRTMNQLMEEFPEFCFSQSQASVYRAMQEYAPEVFAMIQRRVAEGRWEVTASEWVEGDKNLASGESLCRHLLYTRRWFRENLGLPPEAVKIDWACDTFGHCWTLPGILARGGVSRYYHHRSSGPRLQAAAAGEMARLYWWQGPDGSRVLAFDDSPYGYNNEINPGMVAGLFDWERNTGLKEMLWVYGVGNHGGGPTRRHLRAAEEMQRWPLWPTIKLTTTDDFFNTVEGKPQAANLPVFNGELNFVFEGCYSSQSRIKFANRQGENALVEAEALAVLARGLVEMDYPGQALTESWQRALFLQFHDILPGSASHQTYEHAQGLFQETLANTGMIKARALQAIAARVDTSAFAAGGADVSLSSDLGLGAGAGEGAMWGGVSTWSAGPVGAEPFVVCNPAPFWRDELIRVKIWNRELPDSLIVRDSAGRAAAGQVVERGHYWGHRFTTVAFLAKGLPALGYRAYAVEPAEGGGSATPRNQAVGCYFREVGRPVYGLSYVKPQYLGPVVLGNEHLEVNVSGQAGGIISLVDKQSGQELVAEGAVLGALDREQEAPHGMTAWQLGAITDRWEVLRGSVVELVENGPNVVAVRLSAQDGESTYALTIRLARGSRWVEFDLDVNWLERGDPETGVPVLRASFPLNLRAGRARFEIPCGWIERPADGEEVPALNWADLNGESRARAGLRLGARLLNDSKYGHRASENTLRLTLLRSSYDPDPLPELGQHRIRYVLAPYVGEFDPVAAVRAGYCLNHPCFAVGATAHPGDLPPEFAGLEVFPPNVMISGLKKAEDSDALIVRLYELSGRKTEARVRLSRALAAPDAPAVETDLLERPLAQSTARMEGEVLAVTVPAFGIATVKVG